MCRRESRRRQGYNPQSAAEHAGALVSPVLVKGPGERLLAFFASTADGYAYRAEAPLATLVWEDPQRIGLPSNGNPLAVAVLRSVWLVMVFNNMRDERARWPLSIAMSLDHGMTWLYVRDLQPFEKTVYSNRRMLQADPGVLGASSRWGVGTTRLAPPPSEPEFEGGGAEAPPATDSVLVTRGPISDVDEFADDPPPPEGKGEFSFPAVVVDRAIGAIHIAYTMMRETVMYVRVNEHWIRGGGTVGVFQGDEQPLGARAG